MQSFDQDKLQQMMTVLDNDISGESLEYDELYLGLDELALGTPANQMGDSIIEGKDPDFKKLVNNCLKLWENTRDLRVASFFTLGSLAIYGLKGLHDGLSVINYLVEQMYDNFYPQLDPDDDNDPTERINILAMISPEEGAFSDPYGFLGLFRKQKLVDELPYVYRDYLIAAGFIDGSENDDVDLNMINTQMSAIPASSVVERIELIDNSLSLIQNFSDLFNEHTQDTGYLSMASLEHELKNLKNFYKNFVNNVAVVTEETQDEDNVDATAQNDKKTVVNVVNSSFNIETFAPRNRSEALLLLKKSADYFAKAEPTSPVPFLIDRALRMANMNFLDLLTEIDQNAAERGREQLGVQRKEESY